ncbi:hypothetical protein Dimus_007713 [Dionaea muscipula]
MKEWIRRIGHEQNIWFAIQRTKPANGQGKGRIYFGCEKSGSYRNIGTVDPNTDVRKSIRRPVDLADVHVFWKTLTVEDEEGVHRVHEDSEMPNALRLIDESLEVIKKANPVSTKCSMSMQFIA